MDKMYLEQVLEQFVDKANVVIQTKDSYCLGNHWAARWLTVLDGKFTCGFFKVSNITQKVTGSRLTWVITIDHERDWVTDRLSALSNCVIVGLDY